MAFSDAFLSGFKVGKYKDEENQALLTALLNRKSSTGGGVFPSRVVGGGDPLARVNQASREREAEELRDTALQQAEQEGQAAGEQQDIKTEMMRRDLAAKPTALDSSLDRASAAWDKANAGAVARDQQAVTSQQTRMAEEANQINQFRQMMYQGYINRDMEALTRGFNGAFPIQSIERDKLRGRDEDTGKEMDYMKYSNQQAEFRTGENGNIYIKYPASDEWVPFNDEHMRQFMIASNPKLLQSGQPAPAKKAASTTTAAAAGDDDIGTVEEAEVNLSKMSEKDKGKYLLDKSKDNRDTMKARTEYAKTLATNVAGEIDEEKWAKAWAESGKILGNEKAQKQLGFPTPKGYNVPVSEAAGTKAAVEYAKKLDEIKATRGDAAAVDDSKMIQGLLLAKFGAPAMLAFQDELMKSGPEWFTGVKIPANYKTGKYDTDGNLKPKPDAAITPGVPDGLNMPAHGETATIGGTPINASGKGPPKIYDFKKEQWRPATAQESAKLLNNLEKTYNDDPGFKEDLAKIKKILTALNTYGTGRKKGEPTLVQKYLQTQAEAAKGPARPAVDMHGNKIPWQKKPAPKKESETPKKKSETPKPEAKAESGTAYAAEMPKPKSALANRRLTKDEVWEMYQQALEAEKGGKGGHIEGAPSGVKLDRKETKDSIYKKYLTALENQEAVTKAVGSK